MCLLMKISDVYYEILWGYHDVVLDISYSPEQLIHSMIICDTLILVEWAYWVAFVCAGDGYETRDLSNKDSKLNLLMLSSVPHFVLKHASASKTCISVTFPSKRHPCVENVFIQNLRHISKHASLSCNTQITFMLYSKPV